jgi:hypothetical protein
MAATLFQRHHLGVGKYAQIGATTTQCPGSSARSRMQKLPDRYNRATSMRRGA